MKNYSILFAGLMLTFGACAQKNVPQNVEMAFKKQFPTAQKASWDKESAEEWEAEFRMNGMDYSANFSNDGKWKETEYKVKSSDLPVKVQETLKTEFGTYKIAKVEVSESPNGTVYEVELKGENEMEVVMDENGKVIKQQMESDEKDSDKED